MLIGSSDGRRPNANGKPKQKASAQRRTRASHREPGWFRKMCQWVLTECTKATITETAKQVVPLLKDIVVKLLTRTQRRESDCIIQRPPSAPAFPGRPAVSVFRDA